MSYFEEMKKYFKEKADFMPDAESMEEVREYIKPLIFSEELKKFDDNTCLKWYLRDLAKCALYDGRYQDLEEIARAIRVLDLD